MKRNSIIELEAGKAIYGGKCLSHYEEKAVMLERCLPGELVKARVKKSRKSHAEAVTVEVLKPSEKRIPSVCKYYPVCGGCKLLDVDYDYQAEIKSEVVLDCITRLGKAKDFEYMPIIPSEKIRGYRNKMEFTFSSRRYRHESFNDEFGENSDEKEFYSGFHAPKVYQKVIDVDYCHLQSELLNKIYLRLKNLLKETGEEAYNVMEHVGFYRYLVLRETAYGDVMINLITKREDTEILKPAVDKLMSEFPEIKAFINTINSGLGSVAYGEKSILIAGSEVVIDKIGKYNFEISCNSFFQVNPHQTENLYDQIVEFAEFKGDEEVIDLYCGVGTISIYVSEMVKHVVGFELVENAVINAGKNANLNKITNTEFFCGDMMKLVKENNIFKSRKFDTIITDPPRDGMHPKVVKSIIDSKIKKIVYVSCNPSTFARDIQLLSEGGYKLIKARAVDMFPNTYHVETIGLLVKE